MPTRILDTTQPERIANLLSISDTPDGSWSEAELGAVFKHQLSAPVECDLSSLSRQAAQNLRKATASQGLLLKSFGDLLGHPNPPIELLQLTKQFAKASRNDQDSSLPPEIATVLYFASIAAALARCGQRITQLEDDAMRDGFIWCRDQAWMDDGTRELFVEGLNALESHGSA